MSLQHPDFKSVDPLVKNIDDINNKEMRLALAYHYLFEQKSLTTPDDDICKITLEKIDRLYDFSIHFDEHFGTDLYSIFRLDDRIIGSLYVELTCKFLPDYVETNDGRISGRIRFCKNGSRFMKTIYKHYVTSKERLWKWNNFISKFLKEKEGGEIRVDKINTRNANYYFYCYYRHKKQHPNFKSFDPMIECINDIDEEIFSSQENIYHENYYMELIYIRKTSGAEKNSWDRSKLASFKVNPEKIDRVYYVNSEYNFLYHYDDKKFEYHRGPFRIIVRLDYEGSPLYVDVNSINIVNIPVLKKYVCYCYIFVNRDVNEFIQNCVMEGGKKWNLVREVLKRDVNVIVRNENMYL